MTEEIEKALLKLYSVVSIESVPEPVVRACKEIDSLVGRMSDDGTGGLRSTQVVALLFHLYEMGIYK